MNGITQETLALMKTSRANGVELSPNDALAKIGGWSVGVGLVNYDLEPVAQLLFPNPTPLRNLIPRIKSAAGDTAHRWKAIMSLPVAGLYPSVAEGQRGAIITPVVSSYSAHYITLGIESQLSYEAELAAQGFDNAQDKQSILLLQSLMNIEEKTLLGNNYSQKLGKCGAVTGVVATSGGSIASAAYTAYCVPLTPQGYDKATSVTPNLVVQQFTRTSGGPYSNTETINGGTGIPSDQMAGTSGMTSSANKLTLSCVPVAGAVAYAWYVGTTGAERLESITTVSKVVLTSIAGTGQLFSALTQPTLDYSINDASQNSCTVGAYDGLIAFACKTGTNAYKSGLTAGATLTSDGEGGIAEITTAFKSQYDNYRLGSTHIWMASDVAILYRNLCVANGASTFYPMARYMTEPGKPIEVVAGAQIPPLWNPFMGELVPVSVHPYLPPGTILGTIHRTPQTYPLAELANPVAVRTRRDYWQINWPPTRRAYELGIYCDQTLEHRLPMGLMWIYNITT